MKEDFKLQVYFNMYKDSPCGSRDFFRWQFTRKHGYYRYLPELLHMVEEYQRKKYGGTLWYNKNIYSQSKKGKKRR